MAPEEAEKFVLLKVAIPFTLVEASSIVMVEASVADELASVRSPVWPSKDDTLVVPLQPINPGSPPGPTPLTKHSPAVLSVSDCKAPTLSLIITPLAAKLDRPVPPLATDKSCVSVRPEKVGLAVVVKFCGSFSEILVPEVLIVSPPEPVRLKAPATPCRLVTIPLDNACCCACKLFNVSASAKLIKVFPL